MPTKRALVPIMTALITDELLQHTDANIQVAVASCFSELTRISAPVVTYRDAHMKEFFKLSVIALRHLSSESGINYSRALNILETMAVVRSCLILLDIDCDELVVDMFQLFFNTIGNNRSSDTFKYMEIIMTMVIQESDEISFDLLKPILDSVKMDNKNISPISWELGNTIFKNCSAKLQFYLREAVKSMKLDCDDYAEIVSAVCQDGSNIKNMELCNGEPEDCIPNIKNDGGNILDGENSPETSKLRHVKSKNGESDVANEVVDVAEVVQPLRRRTRKPSLRKPDEGYELPWETRHKDSYGSVNEGNSSRKGRTNKKEGTINQPKNLDPSNDVDKRSRRPRFNYGEDLINLKIRVWWPKDKVYYPGTIASFDPVKKKHEVLYDDGETEILNMDKEIWEPIDEQQCLNQQEEAGPSAPFKESVVTQKKTAKKRNSGSSKKQNAASSSKRSKGRSANAFKSAVLVKDEPRDEMYDLNAPPKNEESTDDNTDTETP